MKLDLGFCCPGPENDYTLWLTAWRTGGAFACAPNSSATSRHLLAEVAGN